MSAFCVEINIVMRLDNIAQDYFATSPLLKHVVSKIQATERLTNLENVGIRWRQVV